MCIQSLLAQQHLRRVARSGPAVANQARQCSERIGTAGLYSKQQPLLLFHHDAAFRDGLDAVHAATPKPGVAQCRVQLVLQPAITRVDSCQEQRPQKQQQRRRNVVDCFFDHAAGVSRAFSGPCAVLCSRRLEARKHPCCQLQQQVLQASPRLHLRPGVCNQPAAL